MKKKNNNYNDSNDNIIVGGIVICPLKIIKLEKNPDDLQY